MGVPKFFRYTSERYPCLNELVKQYQIPDFDHMYLDMNGIIHNCSHPDDSNPHFRITEEKIFEDIFHYISILFQIIKPKKLFFMAIDGVAPRAKMNQQRGRRFRSAREADRLEEEAKKKGETLPSEKRFDSNCITPGTVFMARLHEQLRFFVKRKITCDPLWSKVKVVLSGHETPGEGEHKIMDYIRWARSQPEYDPNTRHCLYGLDADLIMLGMCTHEPHFALLREEVKFGRNAQRVTSPEETNFYLLHLSLLKEYLEQEFIEIKDNLPFPYDIEKIVDDWVLMGFLVGNDFIPNLPNMHIGNEAVPLLYKTYMKVLPTLSGYINEAGELNLERFEIFMQELAKIDKEMFQETFVDLQYFEAKTGRRPNANERKEYKPNDDETFNVNVDDIKAQPDDDLQALINATDELFMNDDEAYDGDSSDEGSPIGDVDAEFKLHKRDYYMTKLDYSSVTDEVLAGQAEGYVRAIQWNLYYYYKGCPSWCWYYPHHYAPYMSDIKGFKDLKIEFELGDPFKPFEQLLAVLPAASKNLLPTPFHDLMTDQDSAIVHYYPVDFETDLNGKVNDWEAVVLIPFIDEVNLLSAMAPCYQRLTEEEHKRNTHGPMLVYNWTATGQGLVASPKYFCSIEDSHAMELFVWRKDLEVPLSQLKRGVLPNARTDMLYPGFPTMRHLKYQTSLKSAKVRVFDQPSRNKSMIVEILNDEKPSLEAVAQELLGQTIWVGWPHLTRAKVVSVSNEKMRLHHVGQQNNNIDCPAYTTEMNVGSLHQQWLSERTTLVEHNINRLGIELGPVNVIVHAINHKGYKYVIQDNSKMVLEPEFCSIPCGYALQAAVVNVSAYVLEEIGKFSTPQEAYPPGDQVFLLTQGQYYGCQATVINSEAIRSGRIKVSLRESIEPTPVANAAKSPYNTANHASASCGISAHMLARITGVVLIAVGEKNSLPSENQNKKNIGLNLKLNKKNLEVSGYTRKCPVTQAWLYSHRCVELVSLYAQTYPELFDKMSHANYNDLLFESDVWPNNVEDKKATEIATWLKSLPHADAPRRECGTECLEPEEMKDLADCLDAQLAETNQSEKTVSLQVKWSLLYKPELYEGNIQPDPKADFKLYDRVVCVAKNITVPFGAKGTVTALHPAPNANTVRLSDKLNADGSYQVMFDEPFPGAIFEEGFSQARFYRMQPTHLLNISFGRKLRDAVAPVQNPNQDALGFTYNNANKNQSNNRSSNQSNNRSSNQSNNQSSNQSNNQPTNILRRGDGLNSAFASYSPPVDKKTSPFENRNNSSNVTPALFNSSPAEDDKNGLHTDNATHLLKSLLKISENESESKKNKDKQEQNWRVKEKQIADLATPPQPQPSRMQQPTNWRKEHAAQNIAKQQQPGPNNMEWSNSNFKQPPPPLMPPFPTFGAMPVPGPTQIPFPQFQSPRFNPRQPNQNPRQPNQSFPKHLPSVAGNNVTLGPSWMGQEKYQPVLPNVKPSAPAPSKPQNGGQSSADKLSNPFVPLQVQTSRRRIQNTSETSSKKNTGEIVMPQYVLPKTEPLTAPVNNQQPLASKPTKKKKPRIAANLPFQMD